MGGKIRCSDCADKRLDLRHYTTKLCQDCGTEFRLGVGQAKKTLCDSCKEKGLPLRVRTKVCVDCSTEFDLGRGNGLKIRCVPCQKKRKNQLRRERETTGKAEEPSIEVKVEDVPQARARGRPLDAETFPNLAEIENDNHIGETFTTEMIIRSWLKDMQVQYNDLIEICSGKLALMEERDKYVGIIHDAAELASCIDILLKILDRQEMEENEDAAKSE